MLRQRLRLVWFGLPTEDKWKCLYFGFMLLLNASGKTVGLGLGVMQSVNANASFFWESQMSFVVVGSYLSHHSNNSLFSLAHSPFFTSI